MHRETESESDAWERYEMNKMQKKRVDNNAHTLPDKSEKEGPRVHIVVPRIEKWPGVCARACAAVRLRRERMHVSLGVYGRSADNAH